MPPLYNPDLPPAENKARLGTEALSAKVSGKQHRDFSRLWIRPLERMEHTGILGSGTQGSTVLVKGQTQKYLAEKNA